jgi:hypothetical protein
VKLTAAEARKLGLDAPAKVASRKPKSPMAGQLFDSLCLAHGVPVPAKEFRFDPPRKWMFDYFWHAPWPSNVKHAGIALEVEGGVWTGGRHVRGSGFLKDCDKYNEAAIMGICVLRCTPADIESGAAFALVKRALMERCFAPMDGPQ